MYIVITTLLIAIALGAQMDEGYRTNIAEWVELSPRFCFLKEKIKKS